MEKALIRRRARDLRKNSTDAEQHLWYYLRANRLGYKFKRQEPVGNFIVDFICYKERLVIELDGGQHQEMRGYDTRRTEALSRQGFRVLRFWNNEVLQNTAGVLTIIRQALSPTLSREFTQSHIQTSSAGEGVNRSN